MIFLIKGSVEMQFIFVLFSSLFPSNHISLTSILHIWYMSTSEYIPECAQGYVCIMHRHVYMCGYK